MDRQDVRRVSHRRIMAVYPLARLFWNVYQGDGDAFIKEVVPALVTDQIVEEVETWSEVAEDGRTRHRRRQLDVRDVDERTVFASAASGCLEAADEVANYLGTFADEDLPDEYR